MLQQRVLDVQLPEMVRRVKHLSAAGVKSSRPRTIRLDSNGSRVGIAAECGRRGDSNACSSVRASDR